MSEFDQYANDYVKYINANSRLTGEKYEYFIELRINLMCQKLLKELVDRDSTLKILDFGCGIGVTEKIIKNKLKFSNIYGVDESEESIKVAKQQKLDNVEFEVTNNRLPFKDNFFDIIYSNGTFHHIDPIEHSKYLNELFRVLKSGGFIFVFENNPYNPLIMRAMKKNPFDSNAEVIFPKYLKYCMSKAGFKIKGTQFYFFFPRFLKFLRFLEKYLEKVPFGAQYFVWGKK